MKRKNIPQFFFDTADIEYIKKCWQTMLRTGHFTGKEVVGITTNPNALAKVSCDDMVSFDKLVLELCKTVTAIRGDDEGVVYVQIPNSKMDPQMVVEFAKHIAVLSDDHTRVALKIPPLESVLKLTRMLQKKVDVNVTGVADCATAMKCITHEVNYVSVIPGRMEEVGIDAIRQVRFINQCNMKKTQIITGSMRTLTGLQWVIQEGTVPTIGSRVFDLILANGPGGIKAFKDMWTLEAEAVEPEAFSPNVTDRSTILSVAFFEQMDSLGQKLYEDYLSHKK